MSAFQIKKPTVVAMGGNKLRPAERGTLASGCAILLLWLGLNGNFSSIQAQHQEGVFSRDMEKLQVPSGYRLELVAAEPEVLNMVALSVDVDGSIFVAETDRYQDAVFDVVTMRPDWLPIDLSLRTVKDRTQFLKQTFRDDLTFLGRGSERLRRLTDFDGDGVMEQSDVLAKGFHSVPTGPAAGVLAHRGKVWFASLPHLWEIKTRPGQREATSVHSIAEGFGVHVGVSGHDLHGLVWGPEGRLYFSMGDRGFHVQQGKRLLAYPDTGAVLRCEPDGSHLEVVATGLRNPQELVFDPYGALFAGDNDTAGEDQSRILHVIKGADYGWRCSYQHMEGFGPWVQESRWKGGVDDILPSVGYVAQGPAGFAVHPEARRRVGLPGPFFLSDFPGGIRSFDLKEHGATYKTAGGSQWLWHLWATDLAFAPDGTLVVSDWVAGWQQPNKGRLYRLRPPPNHPEALGLPVQSLLSQVVQSADSAWLTGMLDHPNQLVRREVQFQLAACGSAAVGDLEHALATQPGVMGRLHALWALSQISRASSGLSEVAHNHAMALALNDPHPMVRRAALQWYADDPLAASLETILERCHDDSSSVRLHAWMALGAALSSLVEIGSALDVQKTLEMALNQLEALEADAQPHLLHGYRIFLRSWLNRFPQRFSQQLESLLQRYGPLSRGSLLLAMKGCSHPSMSIFLDDPSRDLRESALRAIYELRMGELSQEVINHAPDLEQSSGIWKRWLWTFYYAGDSQSLQNLIDWLAQRQQETIQPQYAALFGEAIGMLAQWHQPRSLDPVDGLWRPSGGGQGKVEQTTWERLSFLFDLRDPELGKKLIQWAVQESWDGAIPRLEKLLQDQDQPDELRGHALHALASLAPDTSLAWITYGLKDVADEVRTVAMKVAQDSHKMALFETLMDWWDDADSSLLLKRSVLELVATMPGTESEAVMAQWWQSFESGTFPEQLSLDLLNWVQSSDRPDRLQWWRAFRKHAQDANQWPYFDAVLHGGDPIKGRYLFEQRAEIACLRCHRITGKGGVVGPALDGLGQRASTQAILRSILYPNEVMAPGYVSERFTLQNEEEWVGVVLEEDDEAISVRLPSGVEQQLMREQIIEREPSLSAMPEGLIESLTPFEVRDLIGFLKSL